MYDNDCFPGNMLFLIEYTVIFGCYSLGLIINYLADIKKKIK